MTDTNIIPCVALLILASAVVVAGPLGPPLPAEVTAFVEQRDLCDHFRGEDPYDEERRQFLDRNIVELCTGTDEKLAVLKRKYQDNEAVRSALAGYEINIEMDR